MQLPGRQRSFPHSTFFFHLIRFFYETVRFFCDLLPVRVTTRIGNHCEPFHVPNSSYLNSFSN